MSVRRAATWWGAVCLVVGTAVALAAAPAVAEGESVRVRAPKSISAGGSAGSVTVSVSMRSGGCVNVRTVLAVHLPGLTADQVELRVAADGDWRRVPVADAANGIVVGERTAPDKAELCAKKSVSSRYRVNLAEGVPGGRVTLLAEAYGAGGRLLGRGTDSARVTGRTGDRPESPERTPELVIPSATVQATEEPVVEATQAAAAAVPTKSAAAGSSGGSLGLGGLVMVVGVVMVGIGVALIVLLIRRGRAERGRAVGATAADADPTARIVLLGAEQTTRIAPAGADPTTRIPPTGQVFRSGARMPGAGPAGPLPGAGAADRSGAARGVPPVVGDQTLILPTAGSAPSRPAGSIPPRQPGTVPPHGATSHPSPPQVAPPVRGGSVPPGDVPPAEPGAAPPRPGGPVPSEPPSAGGPDATLILPPARRPES